MPEELRAEVERVLSSKRRQAYWRNRRAVQRMTRLGSPTAVDRMTVTQLWGSLEGELLALLRELQDGSSPRLYAAARGAYDCYAEIMSRGDQLTLFPSEELAPVGETYGSRNL